MRNLIAHCIAHLLTRDTYYLRETKSQYNSGNQSENRTQKTNFVKLYTREGKRWDSHRYCHQLSELQNNVLLRQSTGWFRKIFESGFILLFQGM